MNEKEDILHNGGLEGLRCFDLFKRKTPGFRRYQSENVKVIDRWHFKICKNNNSRLPYRYWLSVVGILKDGTMVQSSAILDIESPRIVVTENSRYRLQNSELRKTLPHSDFDREELNKFLNGFPRDWMNIFRKELEKIYGKNLYNTEDINKEPREINREIDKVFESLQEEPPRPKEVHYVSEIDKPIIKPVYIPEGERMVNRSRYTYNSRQKKGGVMNNQNVIALQEGGVISPPPPVGKINEDIFRNIPEATLIDQTDIENLLKPKPEESVSEGVDWLQTTNKKDVQKKCVSGVSTSKVDSQNTTFESSIKPENATFDSSVKNTFLEADDLFENILKDTGVGLDGEQDQKDNTEDNVNNGDPEDSKDIKDDVVKDDRKNITKDDINDNTKDTDMSIISNTKRHSLGVDEIKEESPRVGSSSLVDASLVDTSTVVENQSAVSFDTMTKKKEKRKAKALERKSLNEESVKNYIKEIKEDVDYAFEKDSKTKKRRKSLENNLKKIKITPKSKEQKVAKEEKVVEKDKKNVKTKEEKTPKKSIKKSQANNKSKEIPSTILKDEQEDKDPSEAVKDHVDIFPQPSFSTIVEDFIPSSQISVSSTRTGRKTKRKKITMPKDFRSFARRFKK